MWIKQSLAYFGYCAFEIKKNSIRAERHDLSKNKTPF